MRCIVDKKKSWERKYSWPRLFIDLNDGRYEKHCFVSVNRFKVSREKKTKLMNYSRIRQWRSHVPLQNYSWCHEILAEDSDLLWQYREKDSQIVLHVCWLYSSPEKNIDYQKFPNLMAQAQGAICCGEWYRLKGKILRYSDAFVIIKSVTA